MSDASEITPTRDRIESRAYEIFMARGGQDGQDLADWLAAEKELAGLSEQSSLPESANAPSVRAAKTKSVAGNMGAAAA